MSDHPKVSTINPSLKKLQPPPGMGGVQAWLCWRLEKKAGTDKPAKVPYYVSGKRRRGQQGTAEDRDQLVTFEAANGEYSCDVGYDAVGNVLTKAKSCYFE